MSYSFAQVTAYDQVNFVEGPLLISDKVGYNASIYGADASVVGTAEGTNYKVWTSSKTVASGTLSLYKLAVSGNNVSGGYGNSCAKLRLDIKASNQTGTKTKTITAYD